jgi:hypothetical protein
VGLRDPQVSAQLEREIGALVSGVRSLMVSAETRQSRVDACGSPLGRHGSTRK